MAAVTITYLSGPDVARLNMSDGEILDAVAGALQAQGTGGAVIEPRVHLVPDPAFNGHFNVLRGYVAPLNLAGVKIVGDYLENFKQGLPSEMAASEFCAFVRSSSKMTCAPAHSGNPRELLIP